MSKEKKDKHFIKKPVYPGGNTAYAAFIKSQLRYPKSALENKIEGTVVIKYSIDYKGKVSDTKVIKSLDPACDEEAIRIIKKLEFDIPKGPRNIKVLFHKEAKIHFKLPAVKKKAAKTHGPLTASYIFTSQTKKAMPTDADKEKKPQSYNYTISW